MKSILSLIICLISMHGILIGQEVESDIKAHKLEMGFNASPLLQKIVSPQSIFNSTNETLLLFNVRLNDRLYLRSGYNANFSKANFPQEGFNSTNSTTNIGTRLGLEWRNRVSNLWELHYGFDLVYRHTKQKFTSENFGYPFSSDSKRNTTGIGPIVGVAFWPHPRIGIFTEAGFYLTYFDTTESDTFDGVENSSSDFNGWNGTSILPTAIHLKIKL